MDNKFMNFLNNYIGSVIGAIIGVILVCIPGLRNLIFTLAIIIGCAFLGGYIQKNKPKVKENLKNFIDKM